MIESWHHPHHGWFSILGEHKLSDPVFLFPLNRAGCEQPVRPARCPRPKAKSPPYRPHVLSSVPPCHLDSIATSSCSQTVSELTLASLVSMQCRTNNKALKMKCLTHSAFRRGAKQQRLSYRCWLNYWDSFCVYVWAVTALHMPTRVRRGLMSS